MSFDETLITIIIPVYNTPIYELDRCFFSMHHQNNNLFKIIVVDDGSTKNISDYLDNLKNKFKNISIIHKDNEGVSVARNVGITNSITPYICFCDSDDKYNIDFIDKCYKYIKKYNFDLLCGNLNYIPDWKAQKKINEIIYIDSKNDLIELKKSLLELIPRRYEFNVNVGPVAKLYKTKIAKKILFNKELAFGEDLIFNRNYIDNINSALLVPDIFYNYYQNPLSSTRAAIKNVEFDAYKPLWDILSNLDNSEQVNMQASLKVFELRTLNGFTNRTCASNFSISFFKSLKKLKDAMKHPMIIKMLREIKIFNKEISFIDSINVIILRLKIYWLYLLEKKLIYRLGINKDKI